MAVISAAANVAAICAICRDAARTSLSAMIVHLSVADLFVSAFCLGGEAIWTYTVAWTAGDFMCKIVKYWQVRMEDVYFLTPIMKWLVVR